MRDHFFPVFLKPFRPRIGQEAPPSRCKSGHDLRRARSRGLILGLGVLQAASAVQDDARLWNIPSRQKRCREFSAPQCGIARVIRLTVSRPPVQAEITKGRPVNMPDATKLAQFEQIVLPHLNAAYNLARWLMRNEHDAEDAVQEAYLRAFRFFDGFHGGDGRAWLLAIVRNTCRTSLQQAHVRQPVTEFDETQHSARTPSSTPEERMLRQAGIDSVRSCIEELPAEYREVIVMRELEELSYKEIAEAAAVPLGTVMSRLARARARLQDCLSLRPKGARA